MNDLLGHPYTYTDMLQIPLVIAVPGADEPVRIDRVGGQSDILPTIANLAGVSLDGYIHFGQDLLNQTSNLLPQRYYLPSGSFINDKTIFVPGSGFADGTRYPLAGPDAGDAEATEDQFERALKLLHLSDSYVTQLPDKK
jgi:phosphoglycerol transferase MdoB-like AlkP superfamily enzyme